MKGSQGSFAALTSAIALAGLGETSYMETLPKGALITICLSLLAMVWGFVRRDAIKYKTRFDAVEKIAAEAVTQGQFKALSEIVRDQDRRQTIVETKLGLHG